ncbi:sensor histidine kinase [Anaerocolumna jejuensis]|uniref:sensor histidine kinase n=1 Tax=Anaerocolumna jejuensis TaxID=259063 RepID=UPI003F7C90FC
MKEIPRKRIKTTGKQRLRKFMLLTSMHSMLMITVMIVLIASIGIWNLVGNYLMKVNSEIYGIQKNSADIYISGIEDKLSNYITAMGVVSMSNDLRNHIFNKNISRSEMVILSAELGQRINEMTFFLYQSQEVISQRLYTYLPADGYYFWDVNKVMDKSWFKGLKESSPQRWYTYSDVTHTYHLTLAGIINNYNSKSGVWGQGYCCQTITVDTGTLFLPYKSSFNSVFMFDDNSGNVIYDYSSPTRERKINLTQNQMKEIYQEIQESGEVSKKFKLTDEKGNSEVFHVLTRKLGSIDATAVILFDPKQMSKSDGIGAIFATVVLLVFMMLLLILSNRLYNRKLNMLIGKMDKFDEKVVQPADPIGGKDELARIERHLFRMQKRIQTLIQEEYTAKMQVMTAREQALMSCINPHFLYNTLNTISAMACMEGADSTTEMIAALSAMFRYSSEVSRPNVTLKEELSNISDYLYIQSIRYQNAFTYSVDIGEALYGCQVPKLILQPLIENAFKHGFKNQMTEKGEERTIRIWAERIQDALVISIQDNGEGISPERLSAIQERIAEPEVQITARDSSNIGLLNVHQRIRLQYGADYGLQIASGGEVKGVCVSVRMPCGRTA